jgi:hypothetical protein
MENDGHMARTESLLKFANKYGLPTITVRDVIKFRGSLGDSLVFATNYLAESEIKVLSKSNGQKKH